jgi:hypothetical protein
MSAGFVGFCLFIFLLFRNKIMFHLRSWLYGSILLGLPNFFSIYLVIVVLEQGWEASVAFPMINITIILLSTILGKIIFGEVLERKIYYGMAISIIAIGLLSWKNEK